MKRLLYSSLAGLAAALVIAGCESGDSGGSGGSVVGNWRVTDPSGAGATYWVFGSDGSFVGYNDAAHASPHYSGSYSQSGNKVTGSFTNPGVGTGDIDCTVSEDGKSIQIDFIEHWHSPYKHNPLVGTKQ